MTDDASKKAPRIESTDLSLQVLFKDFYVVPDFQREYVWKDENVVKLFEDIYDEFYDADGRSLDLNEYFVGSVVACRNSSGRFELIDGQQRITTIYLAFCAIRDRLIEIGANVPSTLADSIRSVVLDPATGEETDSYRLVLQYEDSHEVLEKIAGRSMPVEDIDEQSASIRHIKLAYSAIKSFLAEKFREDESQLKRFYGPFVTRVKLIRILTPNLSHALKVFETINDRGVGLTAIDLLKNLLFMETHEREHAKLKQRWKVLVDTLDSANEKALRYLRYFILSQFDGDWNKPLREDEIYQWFSANKRNCGIESSPLMFVDQLVKCGETYANYLQGNDPSGQPNRHLANTGFVAGSAARQHLILLLAGRHLTPVMFDRLCSRIENLLFCYILIKESTKTFERNFAQWSKKLRHIDSETDLDAFFQAHFDKELKSRSKQFDFAFSELALDRIQNYKMKYILAKLTQFIEKQAWNNPAHDDLGLYLTGAIHIEHILSQRPEAEARQAFSIPERYDEYAQKLGDLTLLERPINESISNGEFASKKAGYRESQLLLTRALAERPNVGRDTSINRAVADLPEFDGWDADAIDRRQSLLSTLARRIWMSDLDLADEEANPRL